MRIAPAPIRALRRWARNVHQHSNERFWQWHLRHAGVRDADAIQTYTTPQELRALFDIAAACPQNARVLEIGSHLGASTCFIGAALAPLGGRLYCVDTWQNETMPEGEQDTFGEFKRNTAGLNGVTRLLRKRSDQLKADEIELPLHFAFLDGDHSYESTKKDFELVAPWVAENGILAFHDCIYFEGVSRVIGEALAGRQWMVAGLGEALDVVEASQMATIRASIIICTCNRAEHLRQTLVALARVTVPGGIPTEVLVVDNGSSDGTAEVTRQAVLPNMALRYVLERRRGQCFARNTGMAHGQGDIILFTDDDVRPPENWIAGMCAPILSGKARAVTGGIRLAPHLQRPWMEPLHRGWLASTEGIDGSAPYTMFGANMVFSRDVLAKVPAFDTELGPGALGFGDEMLFSWQLLEAGYKIQGALDVEVEHHFEESRLLRSSFLESARKRGQTQAYLDYHWRHKQVVSPRRKHALAQLRLIYWRKSRRQDCRRKEGAARWELELFQRVHYFKSWLKERERTPNYDPRGLIKKQ